MYSWTSLAVAPPCLKIFIDLHQIWILDINLLQFLSVIFDTLGKTHKSILLWKGANFAFKHIKIPEEQTVIVETEAFGVNYADVCIRWGLYESAKQYVGWPITPGSIYR